MVRAEPILNQESGGLHVGAGSPGFRSSSAAFQDLKLAPGWEELQPELELAPTRVPVKATAYQLRTKLTGRVD